MGTEQNCQVTHALTAVLCVSNYQHGVFQGPSRSILHERETLTHSTVSSKNHGPYGQILDLENKRLIQVFQLILRGVERASKAPTHYGSCQRGDVVYQYHPPY